MKSSLLNWNRMEIKGNKKLAGPGFTANHARKYRTARTIRALKYLSFNLMREQQQNVVLFKETKHLWSISMRCVTVDMEVEMNYTRIAVLICLFWYCRHLWPSWQHNILSRHGSRKEVWASAMLKMRHENGVDTIYCEPCYSRLKDGVISSYMYSWSALYRQNKQNCCICTTKF